jgi:hypothetical protein
MAGATKSPILLAHGMSNHEKHACASFVVSLPHKDGFGHFWMQKYLRMTQLIARLKHCTVVAALLPANRRRLHRQSVTRPLEQMYCKNALIRPLYTCAGIALAIDVDVGSKWRSAGDMSNV